MVPSPSSVCSCREGKKVPQPFSASSPAHCPAWRLKALPYLPTPNTPPCWAQIKWFDSGRKAAVLRRNHLWLKSLFQIYNGLININREAYLFSSSPMSLRVDKTLVKWDPIQHILIASKTHLLEICHQERVITGQPGPVPPLTNLGKIIWPNMWFKGSSFSCFQICSCLSHGGILETRSALNKWMLRAGWGIDSSKAEWGISEKEAGIFALAMREEAVSKTLVSHEGVRAGGLGGIRRLVAWVVSCGLGRTEV